jgi:hypothetical protein
MEAITLQSTLKVDGDRPEISERMMGLMKDERRGHGASLA